MYKHTLMLNISSAACAYNFEHVIIHINDFFAIFAARIAFILLLLLHLQGNKQMVSHIEHQQGNQLQLT